MRVASQSNLSRLDVALVRAGLARSRQQAQHLIAAGQVMVDAQSAVKSSQLVGAEAELVVDAQSWVSRAGNKLVGALDDASLAVPARCLDVGASTGGFTQVLLQRGAKRVYAVDVGHGQLAGELAGDARVVPRDGLNAKDLTLADVEDEPVGLVVVDVSFISLLAVLPSVLPLVAADGSALVLVKPQFEVGRAALGRSGIVRDEAARRRAVDKVCAQAQSLGWTPVWQGVSRLPGAHGNIEYFAHLRPWDGAPSLSGGPDKLLG